MDHFCTAQVFILSATDSVRGLASISTYLVFPTFSSVFVYLFVPKCMLVGYMWKNVLCTIYTALNMSICNLVLLPFSFLLSPLVRSSSHSNGNFSSKERMVIGIYIPLTFIPKTTRLYPHIRRHLVKLPTKCVIYECCAGNSWNTYKHTGTRIHLGGLGRKNTRMGA